MANSCTENFFCIFHVGGECVVTGDDKMKYVGGFVSGRLIAKETTYEEIRRLVEEELWIKEEGFKMKYKVNYAEDILLDLVDDIGVAQLINYNNTNGRVYICKIVKEADPVAQHFNRQE